MSEAGEEAASLVARGLAVRKLGERGRFLRELLAHTAAGRLAHRRLTGLEWLVRKGRISAQAATAGARYGQAYRRAKTEPSLPSTLNAQPGATGIEGPTVAQLLEHAEGTASATLRLAM